MREIKFRAWYYDGKNLDSGEMLEGIPVGWSESLISNIAYIEGKWTNCIKVMQSTGLKDKNGKEIYEGDIGLFDCIGGKLKSAIIWNNFVGRYERDDIPYLAGGINGQCEIIGNIYEHKNLLDNENPELLKENK